MKRMALTVGSRYTLLMYLGLLPLVLIGSSLAPALAQRDDSALIAQAQKAVRAKLLRDRGTKASSVLFKTGEKYPVSQKTKQGVRGTGVFRRNPQAPAQDFSYHVIFEMHKTWPPTLTYVSYLIAISSGISK